MVGSVTIRLGTTGKADVQSDFAAIADSGDASAKRLAAAYSKAGDDIAAATKRQADAAAKISAVMPSSTQATVNASVGSGYSGAQNANAAQYAALLAAQERQVEAVRAAIDPLYTAQKRYDSEVAISSGLLRAGAISEAEHAAAVGLSERALQTAKNGLKEHSSALGLNRAQMITAQSAVLRFTDAIVAGRSPITAFALEAHKIPEVLSMGDDGVAGGLAKVAEWLNPVTAGIAVLTAVLAIGGGAWLSYESTMAKLANIANGAGASLGVTGQQLQENAQAAAAHGNATVSAARDIETSYVQMGGISGSVLEKLTGLTFDYAAATGGDAKSATQELGRILQDPIKGAEELASKYGLLTQAQVEEIRQTAEQNGDFTAQGRLLDDLGGHIDGAAKHVGLLKDAWNGLKSEVSGAIAEMSHAIALAGGGGTDVEQLQSLKDQRSRRLSDSYGRADTSDLDAKIAPLQKQVDALAAKDNAAAGSRLAQNALQAGSGYSGYDQKSQLEQARASIASALNDPNGRAQLAQTGQLQEARQELEAYTHALTTYLGPAEKKRQLDLADVAIAQARAKRDPAALAAASANRERIEQAGQVATKADVEADAMAKGERARARLDGASDKHAATLARESAAIDANTRAAQEAAKAYMTGGAPSGEEAEARRKAVTSATKKGTDVDAATRQQIAASAADSDLAGAKSISALDQETEARRAVNAEVEKGALSVDGMAHALSDEQAVRALTIAQMLAQKNGLTSLYRDITAELARYKSALQDAHAAESDSDFLKTIDGLEDRIKAAKLVGQYAGDSSGDLDRAKALAASNKRADQNGYTPDQRATGNAEAVLAKNTELDAKHKASALEVIQASNDNLAITQAQLGMVGKSADAQQLVVDKLKLQQKEAHDLGGEYDTYAPAILASAAAADVSAQHLKTVQGTMSELRQEGDRFIDDLFNPNGDGLKNLLKDVEEEMLKLAAINPLKNLLLGENNPTAGSVGGLLGKLFGGGGGDPFAATNSSIFSQLGSELPAVHFAAGTDYSPAGVAEVGENGPERVYLPQGSRVTNAADTRRMMGAASGPSHVTISVETNDDVFNAKVSRISGAHIQAAAPQIAVAGARQAAQNAAVQRRRALA